MYSPKQITVLELLGADRPVFDRHPMFRLVEALLPIAATTDVPGRSSKSLSKTKLSRLGPMGDAHRELAMHVRSLMNIDLPLKPGRTHPFWDRAGVNELASVVAYLGFENFFPDEFPGTQMTEAIRRAPLPHDATGVAQWVSDNLAAGSANASEIYGLMFDLRSKSCVRLAEDDHELEFARIRAEAISASSHAPSGPTFR